MEKEPGSEVQGSVQSEYGPVPVMGLGRPAPVGPKKGRLQLRLPAINPVRKPPGEEGVEGEPTPTLAETQLKGLLANQLRTDITLDEFKLEYDPEEAQYRDKRLAEDQGGPESKRARGYGANPVAVAETLAAIRETVWVHEQTVTQPDTYRGTVKLSRHEMEIEQSMARGRSKKDLLDHLVVMEARPGLHAIAPSSPHSDQEGAEGERSDDVIEDVWQGPLKVLSREDVALHRVSVEDIRAMPRFAKYAPGTPTQHLYVRNLSRKVDTAVLRSVFGRFEGSGPLHINVMTKGRLKGSAFVTLRDVATAQQALEETNGYVLEGKAMVLEYGKGSPKEG